MLAGDGVVRVEDAREHLLPERRHFGGEPARQHRETHDLDEADILFFDVVQLRVRVVDAERKFLTCEIAAQHKVKLKVVPAPPCDWRDRVVGDPARLGEKLPGRVAVAPPGLENDARKVCQPRRLRAAQTQNGHRPADDPAVDVLVARNMEAILDRRAVHRKAVPPALEMVVDEDGPADDRQVGVRADEVVRKERDEFEQTRKIPAVDVHGLVRAVQNDAVLVVVDIGRILQRPGLGAERERDEAVVLPRGEAGTAGIALVFGAEQTGGDAPRALPLEGGGDVLRVFFGLREVHGDLERAKLCVRHPLRILGREVGADVAGGDPQRVVVVRGLLRRVAVERAEALLDLRGARRENAHETAGERFARFRTAVNDAARGGIVADRAQQFPKRGRGGGLVRIDVDAEGVEQGVDRPAAVALREQAVFHAVVGESRTDATDHIVPPISRVPTGRRRTARQVPGPSRASTRFLKAAARDAGTHAITVPPKPPP